MASSGLQFHVHCSIQKPSTSSPGFDHFKSTLSSAFKPFWKEIQQLPLRIDAGVKNNSRSLADAFVDSVFEFVDQPLLPSQSNFAPVDELEAGVRVADIGGEIPDDFAEGVYIRNGPNPMFGALTSTSSMFGSSSNTWVEGEGMLHALYFCKGPKGRWTVVYKNRYVETDTFKLEKQRNKPSFLPTIEGDSPAVLSAYLFNTLRFGKVNKEMSNTSAFEHAGKMYTIAENHKPQEIDILTLQTLNEWDVNGAWDRPFCSHPKKAPGSGELVIMGIDATKPFVEVGVISADGKKLLHKADLKLNRCTLCHEMGVTQRYNVFMDQPLCIDLKRLVGGGPLIKYEEEGDARIGIMPRYGDADSIQWFKVKPNCTFHLFNCFEDGDEVVMWGCRALDSIIPGPEKGKNKFDWFSRKLRPIKSRTGGSISEDELVFPRPYEWRLNKRSGGVKERNLTGTEFSMDFPFINEAFIGVQNDYGYCQLRDSIASSASGMVKYGGLAKLYFGEQNPESSLREDEGLIKVEYHMLEKNTFCSGAVFVPKDKGVEEDDGWVITFVHNEDTNISQVLIIEAKSFTSKPVAKITLPCRVPYGFHGAFRPILQLQNQILSPKIPSLNSRIPNSMSRS
ncbi:carotenoid cleavage dioxygenase 1, CAROTENOID CLEAVAGE DIOXYGENASE 1 [Hibiscus trionum]|uniref:Carotenoid cleavage dioxygenase 1, CAROTENOID CLEAVAGE DIOXYGENASE 1 n=1 Tax=Hibiscus trionum TaxID=183268 RepID=A0A9W7J6R9_HIBTR|nr:carotenoid cleavage dioxygenase 1, CAROTENOID CLEAVAGE DIOXYGENASE 1 [Hibiscus trionum]